MENSDKSQPSSESPSDAPRLDIPMTPALRQVLAAISVLPQWDQDSVTKIASRLRQVVSADNQNAMMAFSLVSCELASILDISLQQQD
jgi:hypothetical protein